MSKNKNTALILGSNGLIGSELLLCLLQRDEFETVYAVSRKPLAIQNPKLINIIADQDNFYEAIKDLKVSHYYNCLGTTKKKTPDPADYYQTDLTYPIEVGKILKNNGCKSVAIVSSIGANSNSSNFYLKLKGNVESSFIDLNFPETHIFRPSILLGARKEKRLMESFSKLVITLLGPFLWGKSKNYKSISAKQVASAMVQQTILKHPGIHIYLTEEIKKTREYIKH